MRGWRPPGPAPRRVVDLAAVRHNVDVLRAAAPGAALMAVVKADGYGHGAVPVARAALQAGATWLGVCTLEEALDLRAAGVDAPAAVLAAPARRRLRGRRRRRRRPLRLLPRPPGRRAGGRPARWKARPAAPQDRHRAHPQRRAARRLARRARRRGQGRGRRLGAGGRRLVAPGARRRARTTPRSTGRPPASTRPGAPRATAAWTRSATWPTRPPPSPARTCTSTSSARASPCTGSTRSADPCRRARCARR